MAGSFFDTSALGEHYHQEIGTPKVSIPVYGRPE
jgi:hypothetical protein